MLRIEANQQFPIAPIHNESQNLLTQSLSYSKNIISAIPPAINNSQVGPSIILGAACSLQAIISCVFPALNSTLMDSCITLGSLAFYETLYIVDGYIKAENKKGQVALMEVLAQDEAAAVEIDYSQRVFNQVEPLVTKGGLVGDIFRDQRYGKLNIGFENTVDEVCQLVAEMERCDPSEVLILISDQDARGTLVNLDFHSGKTLEWAFSSHCDKRREHGCCYRIFMNSIDLFILPITRETYIPIERKGNLLPNVDGVCEDYSLGTQNTLKEIFEDIAVQRNCSPEEIYLESCFEEGQKWVYFGLREDGENGDRSLKDVANDKYGIDIESDIFSRFQVRISPSSLIKSAR
ncbi:MAG: hypothetical protein Q8K75_12435 [Chlamydiales bacterium]|nr:hypothetical protein [Chlamydiales bacterium]